MKEGAACRARPQVAGLDPLVVQKPYRDESARDSGRLVRATEVGRLAAFPESVVKGLTRGGLGFSF